MRNSIILGNIILALLLGSCSKERLTANGNVTTEFRDLGTFTGIHTSGSSKIHISYGTEYKVELRGSSNLLPYFQTDVVNNKLYLQYGRVSIKRDDLEVFVTMPTLRNISLSGSADLDLSGSFPTLDFLRVAVSGSGDVVLNSDNTADGVDFNISGSGKIDFGKLSVRAADISISGSGDANIAVRERLEASISGSGKIYYQGNPVIDSHISGSGKIVKR